MIRELLLVAFLSHACGSAEIIAPAQLSVIDTSPGNGSVILPGEVPIAILFSEDVLPGRVEASVRLEETTEQGATIRELPLHLESYDEATFTTILGTDPLLPSTIYALTVSAETMRAASGARMVSDLVHRFRTGE